jgi:hypothetical protein
VSGLKKIVAVVAIVALAVFAPQIGATIAMSVFGSTSAFLGAIIGSVVLAAGAMLIQKALGIGAQKAPPMDAGKVNVRITEPERWLNAGRARQGGGVLFAEFDSAGNFWYLVVHSDEILHSPYSYFLDDMPVTLDGSNYVVQKEFRLKNNKERDAATTNGEGVGYVQIWTTTYTESNPVPARITALDAAFPSKWTSDHRLVGTTFSVVKMRAIPPEHRHKIYRSRGPIGVGEPSVSVVGDWANVYDPRDVTQTLGNRATYKPSRNAALIWAWFRTHPYGRNKPESSINWERVAEQADICDQTVVGIDGSQKRYEAGVAIIDSKRRADAEVEILLAMDGVIVFDEDGKTWARAGHWETPTLSFSRNRDIMAMESIEAQDGESDTQGVIVRYTDPNANYSPQPSRAWLNPYYYDPATTPKFLIVEILACQNHNQAMRLAKAIGLRSQPIHKIAPTLGLRGLRARHERIVTINYDNTFAGDYEIATPVELESAGIFTGFGAVPINENRWTLLEGEEQSRPVLDSADAGRVAPAVPSGLSASYLNSKIKATFDAPIRDDVVYEVQYIIASAYTDDPADVWSPMNVDMATESALSEQIVEGASYLVRARAVAASGLASAWTDPEPVVAVTRALRLAIYNSWVVEASQGIAVMTIDADGTLTITNSTRRYPDGHPDVEVEGDEIETGLSPGEGRSVAYDDLGREGGVVTYDLYDDDNEARTSEANPGRHYMGYFYVPTEGSSGGGGGGSPGGPCVVWDTPILMAAGDRSGPGAQRVARDIQVGDYVWTHHEVTMKAAAYRVSAIEFVEHEVYRAEGYPRATPNHRFFIGGEWVAISTFGEPDGTAMVAKITVDVAHTYISAGVLSHNIKPNELL